MDLIIKDKTYKIIITYKNNKNLYLRVKPDLNIYISAPSRMSEKEIKNFILKNSETITKMIEKLENKKVANENKFLYLGKKYNIYYTSEKGINFGENSVFVNKEFDVYKFYKKEASILFKERLDICFSKMQTNIPYPDLKIRKMKSKWGICNCARKVVTLNLELIKLDIKYLDYVIFHELCHFIHANHSAKFWKEVEKYQKDYKKIRKDMKNVI